MSVLKTRYISQISEVIHRPSKQENPKLFILSCEGPVTEEIYFKDIISNLFKNISSKIQIISARDVFYSTNPTERTQADFDEQNRSSPRQVLDRLNNYINNNTIIDKDNNPDDEYWLVLDIDDHTNDQKKQEWDAVLNEAKENGYDYAISNPFFELWLLLHHDMVNDDDYKYAVTETHKYEKTNHFRNRLKKASLKNQKEPELNHYSKECIKSAVSRAKSLHDIELSWPQNLGSTVYILVEKIVELDEQYCS